MKNIKRYNEFLNEEINLKKTFIGAALGGSMLLNSPAFTQTNTKKEKDSVLVGRLDNPILVDKIKIGEIKTDSIILHYLDEYNNWKHSEEKSKFIKLPGVLNSSSNQIGIGHLIKFEEIIGYDKILMKIKYDYSDENYLFEKNDFDSIKNLELNKTYKFKIVSLWTGTLVSNQFADDKKLKEYLDSKKDYQPLYDDCYFFIKIGYLNGKKVVRFNIIKSIHDEYDNGVKIKEGSDRKFNIDKIYYEVSYDEFIKII